MEHHQLEKETKVRQNNSESTSSGHFYTGPDSYQRYNNQPQHQSEHGDRSTYLEQSESIHHNRHNIRPVQGKSLTNLEDSSKHLSDVQGLMLLIPYYISFGFLGLPYMVKLVGLWAGLGGLLFYGFLNEACILILVDSTQSLMDRTGENFGDIVSVAEMSMKLGPSWLRPYAEKYKTLVEMALMFNQFLSLAQILSLMTMFTHDLLGEFLEMNPKLTTVVISVLFIPVFLASDIKTLTTLSTIANIILLGIVVLSFQYICWDLPDVTNRKAVKSANYLSFTTFGNGAMFTLDGIGMVLPVRKRMRATKHFDGWNGVLGVAMMFVTCFHAACGFYGYLKFGEITHAMFLLDLPANNWLYKSLKILFLITLYFTIGVLVFVPVDVSWRRMEKRLTSDFIKNYGEYLFRFILLVAVCMFTLLVPEFEWLMSLTGCLWGCLGVFIVPASAKIMLSYDELKPNTLTEKVKRTATVVVCYILLIFGIYGTVSGLAVSLYMTFMNIIV